MDGRTRTDTHLHSLTSDTTLALTGSVTGPETNVLSSAHAGDPETHH